MDLALELLAPILRPQNSQFTSQFGGTPYSGEFRHQLNLHQLVHHHITNVTSPRLSFNYIYRRPFHLPYEEKFTPTILFFCKPTRQVKAHAYQHNCHTIIIYEMLHE